MKNDSQQDGHLIPNSVETKTELINKYIPPKI